MVETNKYRRSEIKEIIESLSIISDKIDSVMDEEELAVLRMPEGFRASAESNYNKAVELVERAQDGIIQAQVYLEGII